MSKKATFLLLGLAGAVGAGVLMLAPKKASASPLEGDPDDGGPIHEGEPVQPKNAQEAYALAMNPKMVDPDYVHSMASWLSSYGQRPDWAAAAEKRAQDLRAEQLLSEGLKTQSSLERVTQLANMLKATHPSYATVLASRIGVQNGAQSAPKPFQLKLDSGSGVLSIDLSIYSPHTSSSLPAGAATPPPSAGGSSTAPAPVNPAAVNVPLPPAPTPQQAAAQAATAAAGAPPLAVEEVKPENDPKGTIALARLLLDEQTKKGWKYISPAVKDWQSRVGLTPDGKFGPGSALRMAQEVAIMPWVRYWPTGSASKSAAVADYRGRLKAFALSIEAKRPEHAIALYRAAELEAGQGWPAAPSAVPLSPVITVSEVDTIKGMIAKDRKAGRVVS